MHVHVEEDIAKVMLDYNMFLLLDPLSLHLVYVREEDVANVMLDQNSVDQLGSATWILGSSYYIGSHSVPLAV